MVATTAIWSSLEIPPPQPTDLEPLLRSTPAANDGGPRLLTADETLAAMRRPMSMAANIAADNGWLLDDVSGEITGRLDVGAILAELRRIEMANETSAVPRDAKAKESGFFPAKKAAAGSARPSAIVAA